MRMTRGGAKPGGREKEERTMDVGGAGWGLQTIIGGLLLVVVLLWAIFRNRSSKNSVDRTERGTRRVYDESEEARRSGDDEV
jgi:hypothetical protein